MNMKQHKQQHIVDAKFPGLHWNDAIYSKQIK